MFLRRIGFIHHPYRHVKRYRQILTILFRYGFGDLIDRLHIGHYIELGNRLIFRKQQRKAEYRSRAERVRMALEELGPTFIKFGQLLSSHPDIIPSDFIRELSKLQDEVPPFPFADVKVTIERDLQKSLGEVFVLFDEIPLAAASIGQVHRGRLKNGEDVVVKVQRPYIGSTIEIDLEILFNLASLIERHVEEGNVYQPTRMVEEFARILDKEMDYTIEALHAERFARQFKDDPALYVPRIYKEYLTKRVLVMEYVEGIKVSQTERLDEEIYDRKLIAEQGADLLLKQIFTHGFFHGDPHPGNLFVLPGNLICYLDFGIMGYVNRRSREDLADMAYAFVTRDEAKAVNALLRIVEREEEPDRRTLETDFGNFMDLYLYKPLKDIRLEIVFPQLFEMIARHRLRIPLDRLLMIKALGTMEGVGLMLDPDFDMIARMAPFVKRMRMERFYPGRLKEELLESGEELYALIKEVPDTVQDVMRQIKQGRAKIVLEHRGLQNFIYELDRSSNRIAFGLVVSSIIVGSSIIINTDIGPHLFGIPLIGLIGFFIAGIMGMWLLIAIIRSGRL